MRRRGLLAAGLGVALLGAASCASSPKSGTAGDVEGAFRHYCALLLAMDHAGIAAMFSADGEIVNAGQAPIRGPAMINAFLAGFADYKVLAYTTETPQIRASGDYATLASVYHETVRTPAGQVVQVSGHLEAQWRRSPRGRWYLTRMATWS